MSVEAPELTEGGNLGFCQGELSDVAWHAAHRAMHLTGLAHPNLSPPPTDYRPIRSADIEPDMVHFAETDLGDFPVLVFNRDNLGDRTNIPDLQINMSLAVRPDQGVFSPFISSLLEEADEQGRAVIVKGLPASTGGYLSPLKAMKQSLGSVVEASHVAQDSLAEAEGVELERTVEFGASLGGYISLTYADTRLAQRRHEQGRPDHEVVMSLPVAPAGWKLRPWQIPRAAWQFMVLEPAHVIDKAGDMPRDEREEYLETFRKAIPNIWAIPGIGRLAVDFLFRGDLEERLDYVPNDLDIRAIVFDGDHVTIPYLLFKNLQENKLRNASVEIIDGRHLSLASARKVAKNLVRPALKENYLETVGG